MKSKHVTVLSQLIRTVKSGFRECPHAFHLLEATSKTLSCELRFHLITGLPLSSVSLPARLTVVK